MYSKIAPQCGCPTSPVVSYSKGAVARKLAPGSPATKWALVSKLPRGRDAGGNCWQSDQSIPHLLTSLVGSTNRCGSSRLISGTITFRVCVGCSWSNADVSVITRGRHSCRNPIVPRTVQPTPKEAVAPRRFSNRRKRAEAPCRLSQKATDYFAR